MTLEMLGQCAGVAPAVWGGCHSPDMTASLYLRRLPVPPHRGDKKWRVAPFGAVESGFTSCSGQRVIFPTTDLSGVASGIPHAHA